MNTDEWWRAKHLFDGFITACKNIAASFLKVGDESMSAIRFWKTAKDNLPHLSYIFRKPDPPGTEFKTIACSVTGDLLFIEVQREDEGQPLPEGARSHCGMYEADDGGNKGDRSEV